jgi:hypothetical protein
LELSAAQNRIFAPFAMNLIPDAGLRQRLMILGGVLLPMLAIAMLLNSRGFFGSP